MRRIYIYLMAVFLAFMPLRVHAAQGAPAYIAAAVPHAAQVGEGRLTYMMMDIYDARLYAPGGTVGAGRPLALSLTYLRHLSGARIADVSIEEMRDQGFDDEITLAGWHTMLRNIFPDVEDGTTLTGILTANGATAFYRDGQAIGRIDDPAFGQHFFDIWLSPKTSEPDLRADLLHTNN